MDFKIEEIWKLAFELTVGDEIHDEDSIHIINTIENLNDDVVMSTTILDDNVKNTKKALLIYPKTKLVLVNEIVFRKD